MKRNSGPGLSRSTFIKKEPGTPKRMSIGSIRSNKKLGYKPPTEEQKQQQKEDIERMWQLFHEHWANKKHQCESCKKPLYGENLSLYHHHCWPKHSHPQYKYVIEGLMLVCWQCHSNIEAGNITEEVRKKIEKIKKKVLEISE
jgi:5-methylcytosine-specific restriction endonuclease McrA